MAPMISAPSIRVATINDLDSLLGLTEKLIVDDHEEGRHFDRKKACRAMRDLLLDSSPGLVLLATDKKHSIGYYRTGLWLQPRIPGARCVFGLFFRRKRSTGEKALAKKMFVRAENAAKKPIIKVLHLEVTRNDGLAIQFYRNAGF